MEERPEEPVWFVRIVVLAVLIGFSVFLAREIQAVMSRL